MSYHLSASLVRLRAQVNERWPNRTKTSDGWIGDPSHQARKSDHNPDYRSGGVVRALDITKAGIDVDVLIAAAIKDPRVSYVIYNRRIWGGSKWRAYEGTNPHTQHVHISVEHNSAANSSRDWALGIGSVGPAGGVTLPPAALPKVTKQSWTNKPNGSTVFPTDYDELVVDGDFTALSVGALQILMRAIGKRNNELWDGKLGARGWKDVQCWLTDLGHYKGLIDGKPGPMTIKALQNFLVKKGHLDPKKWAIDGKFQAETKKAFQRYLNTQN